MWTVTVLLAVAAFIISIVSAIDPPKAPLWVAVLLLSILAVLQAWPVK